MQTKRITMLIKEVEEFRDVASQISIKSALLHYYVKNDVANHIQSIRDNVAQISVTNRQEKFKPLIDQVDKAKQLKKRIHDCE